MEMSERLPSGPVPGEGDAEVRTIPVVSAACYILAAGIAGFTIGTYGVETPVVGVADTGERGHDQLETAGNVVTVDTTFAAWTIDGFHLYLQTWRNTTIEGYTTWQNDLHIHADQSIRELYNSCVHEKLHNVATDTDHDWIYQQDGSIVDETCLKFLVNLGEHRAK